MPCNQMISMNCRPPRPIEDISPARLPMPNEADRKSRMSTIGDSTFSSMKLNAIRDSGEQHSETDAEGQGASPVQSARRADAEFLERPDAPDGAEDTDRH